MDKWLPLINQIAQVAGCLASCLNGLILIYLVGKLRMIDYLFWLTKAVQDD